MRLYAETSAVLSWLLGQAQARRVASCLGRADLVLTSRLTLTECRRCFNRLEAAGTLAPARVEGLLARLERIVSAWTLTGLNDAVLSGAERRFPVEPVRTLDALHLATALNLRPDVPRLSVLSLDDRVRDNASELGFRVLP